MSDLEFDEDGPALELAEDIAPAEPPPPRGPQAARRAAPSSTYAAVAGAADFTLEGPAPSLFPLLVHTALPLFAAVVVAGLVQRQLVGVSDNAIVQAIQTAPYQADNATVSAVAGWDRRIGLVWLALILPAIVLASIAAFATQRRGGSLWLPAALAVLVPLLAAAGVIDPALILLPSLSAGPEAAEVRHLFTSLPAGLSYLPIVGAFGLGVFAAFRPGPLQDWGAALCAAAAAWMIAQGRQDAFLALLQENVRLAAGQDLLRSHAAAVYTEAAAYARNLLWARSIPDVLVLLTPWWALRMSLR